MGAQECGQLSTWDKMFYKGGDKWIGFGWVVVLIVQSLSHVWFFVTPWTVARQASLSFTISQSLLKLVSIELVMPSNHLIPWHPLLLLPSVFGWVAWPNLETEERHSWPGVQLKRCHSLYMDLHGLLAWWEESEGQILEGLYILCKVKLYRRRRVTRVFKSEGRRALPIPRPRQSFLLCLHPPAPQRLAGRAKSVDSHALWFPAKFSHWIDSPCRRWGGGVVKGGGWSRSLCSPASCLPWRMAWEELHLPFSGQPVDITFSFLLTSPSLGPTGLWWRLFSDAIPSLSLCFCCSPPTPSLVVLP